MVLADEAYPLLAREPEHDLAIVSNKLPAFFLEGSKPLAEGDLHCITAGLFLNQVEHLASVLPDHGFVINLCENRYLFTLVFCAAIIRGQTNLLPPNKKLLTQQRMQERYGNVYIAHDDATELNARLPAFSVIEAACAVPVGHAAGEFKPPAIASDQLTAISFTSGSTGDSQPNLKSWRTIVESSRINGRHMLPDLLTASNETLYQLATVPAQHMWGLETSVLLALFERVCVLDSKPLFPQDIADALACLPAPRMLVSTPVHLRALSANPIDFVDVSLIMCATSPLPQALAKETEARFSSENHKAELREVYGCSEVGSMAWRRSACEDSWHLFKGIELKQGGEKTWAATAYLPESIQLQDRILVSAEGRFTLGGRDSDMVDIAGKRGSLQELNKVLLNFPGLLDGIIFMPESTAGVSAKRLAALAVLKPDATLDQLKAYLRSHFDSAFIPRPFMLVPTLPREENGKLPRQQLLAFYQQQIKP